MDSSQHHEPQRLSALYQYHNAPEVAPAHGLEYDDTIYPSSDKYPVLSERMYDLKNGKYNFSGDNRPPRIIFGMKVKTFLVVALVMVLIVVGAAVGGAVGGRSLRSNSTDGITSFGSTNATGATSSSTATATFSAATPTYTPLSDCPASNNTSYTSAFTQTTSSTSQPNAGLHFTKYCDLASPLALSGSAHIAEAFVYSFSDCVEVCAGYNYWNDNSNCTVAVYQPVGASRPGNCWIGSTGAISISSLDLTSGTDIAVLIQSS